MLQASFSHADEDKLARQLAEQRLGAGSCWRAWKRPWQLTATPCWSRRVRAASRRWSELQALMDGDDVDAYAR